MAALRYDPWNLMAQLQNEMGRVLDRRYAETTDHENGATSDWAPAVDIREERDRFVILADVPGVDASKIDIHMENGALIIKGERVDEIEENKSAYKRAERPRGSFYRRFTLPETTDAERVSANSRNGVLQVVIPKQERVQPRKISVKAEAA